MGATVVRELDAVLGWAVRVGPDSVLVGVTRVAGGSSLGLEFEVLEDGVWVGAVRGEVGGLVELV